MHGHAWNAVDWPGVETGQIRQNPKASLEGGYGNWPAALGRARPVTARQPYWLFILFALYGPSIRILGEFRYVEIIVLVLLAINLHRGLRYIGKWEKLFVGLFLVTAFMHVVSDLVNDASIEGTLKRSFTYIILALLVIGVRYLSRGDPMRLRWILAGYCLSYVVVLFLGQSASRNYAEVPWRLGLGTAATFALCLTTLWRPRFYPFVSLGLLGLAGFHWIMDARALAAIAAASGIALLAGVFLKRARPSPFRPALILGIVASAVAGFIIVEMGLRFATEAQLFSAEMQSKMETQLSSQYGLIGGARGDSIAALYAISKPILGHGSTNVDPEVYMFYIMLSIEAFRETGNAQDLLHLRLSKEWNLGTPSHSHVLGAWADAGILAAVSWFAMLWLCIVVLQRSIGWRHPLVPIIVVVATASIWDLLFSPGPIRLDVAIRLSVLIIGLEFIRSFDRERRIKYRFRGTAQ